MVWWAGMMRGAVSVAMVYYRFDPNNEREDRHAATIVVTTLQLVLYSTVGLGGVTGPLLKYLLPQQVRCRLYHVALPAQSTNQSCSFRYFGVQHAVHGCCNALEPS